jgi:hypothetical protein
MAFRCGERFAHTNQQGVWPCGSLQIFSAARARFVQVEYSPDGVSLSEIAPSFLRGWSATGRIVLVQGSTDQELRPFAQELRPSQCR